MSSYLEKAVIGEITKRYRVSDKDTSSADVQIALLTERIINTEEKMRSIGKDEDLRLILLRLVGQRRKFLDYLNATDTARYTNLIEKLGIAQ